ncbi:MAG: glycosyltransferase family 9 protein, partial [Myxococcota bacterium]
FLCALPAMRALRDHRPGAHIVLIGLPESEHLVERFRCYLDDLLPFPGWPGLSEREPHAEILEAFLAQAARRRFDLAIQMHGSGLISNHVIRRLGARYVLGFRPQDRREPEGGEWFLPWRDHEPESERWLRLLAQIGVPSPADMPELPVFEEDRAALSLCLRRARSRLREHGYVCVHPGSSTGSRCWSSAGFAEVAAGLAQSGLQVVVTGSRSEAEITSRVARAAGTGALNLGGGTSFGALAALISGASLLLCNDTGVSHLAALLRVPSVVIFTGSDPLRWAPLDHRLHRSLHRHPPDLPSCPGSAVCSPICMPEVTAERVLAESLGLLNEARHRKQRGERA